MPLLHKKPFESIEVPSDVSPTTKVYYLEASNEIFTNYDEYFERIIELNSTQWSCEFTGKTGLTFYEAVQSEQEALKAIDDFPKYLEIPILYIIKNYTGRGRFDDLLNDIAVFMKDRYFIGEECQIVEDGKRRNAKIIACQVSGAQSNVLNGETPKKEAILPAAEAYRYTVQILDDPPLDDDDGVRELVSHVSLVRNKQIASKPKLKLFLKQFCYLNGSQYCVKEKFLNDNIVNNLTWNLVLGGPEPILPRTPMLQRGRQSKIAQTPTVVKDSMTTPDGKTPSRRKSAGGRGMSEKKKQKILAQQEELSNLFETAKRFNLDISKYEQNERLLSNTDIVELKEQVKIAKEQDREAVKEQKKLKLKAKFEWAKKRDDLNCDDLKPLPSLPSLEVPSYVDPEEFAEYLSILQFFNGFLELLPVKEIRGTSHISISDIVVAIRCNDPNQSPYCDLMRILLSARSERADEEDGNEADIDSREESQLIQLQNCDPVHPVFGDEIRDMTYLHRLLRKTHGEPVRQLPVDWMTLTEVLRLVINTSGYYTGLATHRHRLFARGNYRGYEDPGFRFRFENPETMRKLATGSVFDLTPKERLALMQMLIHQLLTYNKFRTVQEERIAQLYETKRELKKLRHWDQAQEQDATQARLVCESEIEKEGKQTPRTQGKESARLKAHLKAIREARRVDKEEFEEMLLAGVEYNELKLDDIVSAREHQIEKVKQVENQLLAAIFDLSSACGQIYLGRDRAFRNYFFIESLPAVIVENPTSFDQIGECVEETPLQDFSEYGTPLKARQAVLGCTGSAQTCAVHGAFKDKRPRWSQIDTPEMLEEIIAALNPRGNRECDLAEELTYYKIRLIEIIKKRAHKVEYNTLPIIALNTRPDPIIELSSIDFETEMRELLLDLEEKMEQGLVGHLISKVDRVSWRRQLLDSGDVLGTVKEDMFIRDECILTVEDCSESYNSVKKLAIAFLQLIQGIGLKYFRNPFTYPSEPGVLSATKCFANWQRGLLECESISALSLFLSTLEPAILWDKSRLQGKCCTCRKKAAAEELVLCAVCDKCFHPACVKISTKNEISQAWICFDCESVRRKRVAVEKRKATREAAVLAAVKVKEEDCSDENCENDEEQVDITRTSSGRTVKRVTYKENYVLSTPPLKSSRRQSARSNISYESADDEDEDGVLGRAMKRKRDEMNSAIRTASTGLREQDSNSKEKMVRLEQTIKSAMKQDYAWPFLEPVNIKEVPDYYDIIQNPIDLRTMMNKIKNHNYDSPENVREDMQLLVSNCKLYNEEGSEIYECAVQMEVFFDDNVKDVFDNKRIRRR